MNVSSFAFSASMLDFISSLHAFGRLDVRFLGRYFVLFSFLIALSIALIEGIRTALRMGDSALILGEIRSLEAFALYEAMRTRMSFWKITPHLTVPGQSRHSVNPWTGLNTPTGLNNGYIHHVISMNIGRTWMGELVNLIITNAVPSGAEGYAKHIISTFDYTPNAIAWCNYTKRFYAVNNAMLDLLNMRMCLIPGSPSSPSEDRRNYMLGKGFKLVTR